MDIKSSILGGKGKEKGRKSKTDKRQKGRCAQQRIFMNVLLIPMRKILFSLGPLHRKSRPQGQLQNSIPEASGLSLSLKHKQKLS